MKELTPNYILFQKVVFWEKYPSESETKAW